MDFDCPECNKGFQVDDFYGLPEPEGDEKLDCPNCGVSLHVTWSVTVEES